MLRSTWHLLRAVAPVVFTTVFVGVLLTPSLSRSAEPSSEQVLRARDAYRRGLALEGAQEWSKALAQFREVAAIKSTAQVHYHIARCLEKLGQWTEALGSYRMALAEPQGHKEVSKAAEEALAALDQKTPRISLKPSHPSARVLLDGSPLGPDLLETAIPVNPGGHSVSVSLPGGAPKVTTVVLEAGQTTSLLLTPEETTPPAPTLSASSSPSKVLPVTLLVAGGASLVFSAIAFGLRAGALSDLEDGCRGDICLESHRSDYDRARTWTVLGNVALGAGLVLGGTGGLLLWGTRSREPNKSVGGLIVYPSGVVYTGSF